MMAIFRMTVLFAVGLFAANVFAQNWTVIKGEDVDEIKRVIQTDTEGRAQAVQAQLSLHNCDDKTDWTALSNDTTGIDVDLDHTEGSKSLEFDKVDGTDNTVFGGIQKTLTAVNIEQFMENNGFIMVSLNVSATTDISYCFIRLGTDASNYNEWRVDDDALSTGWQQIRYAFYAPSSAGNLGNGMDAAVITYLALGCAFDAETDTLADIRVDNIAVNTNFQTSADLSSQVSAAIATPNVNVVKIGSQDAKLLVSGDNLSKSEGGLKVEAVNYGDDGTALDIVKLGATGEVQMTDVATRPGENSGINAREVKIAYLGVSEPAKVGPTAVDDTAISATTGIIILGPTKTLANGRFCVYVKNVGGGSGDDFSDVEIQDSPDGSSGWVITNTWTSCDTLASGSALCKYCTDDPMPWIQVKARCLATEDTTADAWLKQVRR